MNVYHCRNRNERAIVGATLVRVLAHRLTVEAAAVSQGDQQSSADHAEQ